MRKILLKSAIIAVLFAFAACSSDSGGSSCNEAALQAELEAAEKKYKETGSNEDCLAAVDVIKKALANKCINQEEADSYGKDLPCYTNCDSLEAEFEAAVEKYLTSGSNADCLAVVDVINKALANKCITQEEADSYGAGLDCYSSGGNTGGDDESEM